MRKISKLTGTWITLGLLLPAIATAEDIVTIDGKVYVGVEVVRAEDDGLAITYRPEGGGVGMAKLKFRILSEAIRQHYGYNEQRAAAHEVRQVQAQAELLTKLRAESIDATNRLQRRLAKEEMDLIAERQINEVRLRSQTPFVRVGGTGQVVRHVGNITNGAAIQRGGPPNSGHGNPQISGNVSVTQGSPGQNQNSAGGSGGQQVTQSTSRPTTTSTIRRK